MAASHRDKVTGRFARRPIPDVDAESRFDPMGDSIEDIENVSADDVRPGMVRPRYAPEADDLAQGGRIYPLHTRRPELVPPQDRLSTLYGNVQGAWLRDAVCNSGPADPMDPTAYLTGAE
jgi:hypothetical protein